MASNLTLTDFRTDLQSALGDRGINNTRLDRWINFGYFDLCGAVDFEVLNNDESISTTSSTQTITAPTNTLLIKLVKNTDDDVLLGWVPKAELFRRSITPEAAPTVWTRHKDKLYLHPVPDAVYPLMVVTLEPPDKLGSVADTDTSVLPDSWDPAIFLLAAHHALLALGDERRAAAWLARAVTYIQSRMTEGELQAQAGGLGASLPSAGMSALQARVEDFGVGSPQQEG